MADANTTPKAKAKAKKKKAPSEGANTIRELLSGLDILAQEEVRFTQCRLRKPLPYDFMIIIEGGIVAIIEFDGSQHFEYVSSWHKNQEGFEKQKQKDILKNKFLRDRKIPLLRISYLEEAHIARHITEYITELRKGNKITRFIPSMSYPHPYGPEDDSCCIQ